jgi:hypothetical protein
MPLHCARSRRTAAPALALAALLLAAVQSPAQEKADAPAVADKVKAGTPGFTRVREKLAADPVGARFRLDGVEAAGNTVKVSGVMLVPAANDEDQAATEKAIRVKVISAIQEVAGAKDFKDFDLVAGVKLVTRDKQPHLQLQAAANKAGAKNPAADELKLADSKFDATGKLVITGARGNNPATIDWLASAIRTELASNPAALGPDGKPVPVHLQLDTPGWIADWPMSPAVLRRVMAGSGDPELARIRVDRAYLAATSIKPDETNPAGVSWRYVLSGTVLGRAAPDAKAIRAACDRAFAAGFWDPLKDGDIEGLLNADFRVPDPGPHFQKAVAANPALDGVRIDGRTEFGPKGELALTGLQPGLSADQVAVLTQTVRGVLTALATGSDSNPGYRKLAEFGVSTSELRLVKADELHADLRKWARDHLDETRLTRLYFDENGVLTLTCDSPSPNAPALARAKLRERAAALNVPVSPAGETPAPKAEPKAGDAKAPEKISAELPALAAAQQPKSTGPEPVVKPSAHPIKASLIESLQKMVSDPSNEKWASVLIERGYFDENDRYVVRGVVETKEQRDALAAHLKSLEKDPEWANYFTPKPAVEPNEETMPVIPVAKLVQRAQRVMPAYGVFDGVRVIAARYVFQKDSRGVPGQTLVFDAHVVGRVPPAAPDRLQELIAADEDYYGRRLPKGRPVAIRVVPADVTASDQLGSFTEGLGAQALARGDMKKAEQWLDAGLLHAPHLASVWFLDAYYNHLRGDKELVRRDLLRMIELEDPLAFNGPSQRKRRYWVAKDLQGPKREALEKIWLGYWQDYKDGARPMTFAEPKSK